MFLCIVSQSSILTSREPNGISLFRFWIFRCIENPHGSPLVALCAANSYRAELKDRRLVCSLEAEVGKGLPVSSIGQHLFVHQVHLEQSWKVLTVPPKKILLDQPVEGFWVWEHFPLWKVYSRTWNVCLICVKPSSYLVFFAKCSFFQALLLLNSDVEGIQSSSVAYLEKIYFPRGQEAIWDQSSS